MFLFCFFCFRVANVLKEVCKLETNDVVIVILPRIPQWWAISVGAIRSGTSARTLQSLSLTKLQIYELYMS